MCLSRKENKMSYLEFNHIEDGHKGLRVNDLSIVCQTGEDGRLHIVTWAIHDLSRKLSGGIQFCKRISSEDVLHIHNISTQKMVSNPIYMQETQLKVQHCTFPPQTRVPPCCLACSMAARYWSTACLVCRGPYRVLAVDKHTTIHSQSLLLNYLF